MVASHYFVRLKRLSTPQSTFFENHNTGVVWNAQNFSAWCSFFCLKPLHCLKEMRTHKMRENINHKSTCMDTCSDDLRINLCAFFRERRAIFYFHYARLHEIHKKLFYSPWNFKALLVNILTSTNHNSRFIWISECSCGFYVDIKWMALSKN